MSDKWLWIIGGGLLQVPVVDRAKTMGFKTIVSDKSPVCVCRNLADMFLPIDIFDIEAHKQAYLAIDEVFSQYEDDRDKIVGVVAIGIDAPVTAASLNRIIHPPYWKRTGADPEIAATIQEKGAFRTAQGYLGMDVPPFVVMDEGWSTGEIKSYLEEFKGKPLIVKPSLNSGSRGITVFRDGEIEKAAFYEAVSKAMEASRNGRAVVERFYEFTRQFTVETMFDLHARFWPCFITERYFDPDFPTLEAGLMTPANIPPYLEQRLYGMARDLAKAFGITGGPLKLDVGMTKYGPKIIEATNRFSGGFDCQYLVPMATGKDIIGAAIEVATGGDMLPKKLTDQYKGVAISESLWPDPGKRIKLIDDERAKNIPGVKIFWRYKEGDVVEKYTDCGRRVCFVLARGDDYEQAKRRLAEAKKRIILELEDVNA